MVEIITYANKEDYENKRRIIAEIICKKAVQNILPVKVENEQNFMMIWFSDDSICCLVKENIEE